MTKGLLALDVTATERGGEAAFARARQVAEIAAGAPAKPVRLLDGDGLYLLVEPTGAARWLFLFRWRGKLKEMGLGSLSKVGLKLAREKATDARQLIGRGKNPIEVRHAEAAVPTFGEMADQVLGDLKFKNPKHKATWERGIGAPRRIKARDGKNWTDAPARPCFADKLRPMRVDQITANDVYQIVRPLWLTRQDTGADVRGQIARVLSAAKAAGHRTGENPAAWVDNLKHRLPPRQKLTQGHRPALPYDDMATFMAALRPRQALAAKALEFTILTCARAGETLGATWREIDLDAKLWTVPAGRMKRPVEHRVPLTDTVVELLRTLALLSNGEADAVLFPGKPGKPLSEAAMMQLLRRMEYGHVSVHGFRSAFRDFCGDRTHHPRDLIEQALSHAVGNEVELAYRRSDALERRRKVMETWERFCAGGAEIIELAGAA